MNAANSCVLCGGQGNVTSKVNTNSNRVKKYSPTLLIYFDKVTAWYDLFLNILSANHLQTDLDKRLAFRHPGVESSNKNRNPESNIYNNNSTKQT